MNKELEEARSILEKEKSNINNLIEYYTFEDLDYAKKYRMEDFKKAIEIVLNELENYQIKELQILNNKLNDISVTELRNILQPYYIQKEKLEYKDKLIEELKNKLENSISKEVLKDRIELIEDTLDLSKENGVAKYKITAMEYELEDLKELLEEK